MYNFHTLWSTTNEFVRRRTTPPMFTFRATRRNTRDGRASPVSCSNCVVTIKSTYEIAPSRIVYLVLMAVSRITREQKRCRVHRAPGQLVSRSLVPRHRTQLETRYPRLVSRPIKQLGEERSRKIGLQRSRTLAEYRGNDPLRSAVPRVHVQVWTLYTQSVPRWSTTHKQQRQFSFFFFFFSCVSWDCVSVETERKREV